MKERVLRAKCVVLSMVVAALGLTAFGATNVPYMDYNATTGAFEAKTCATCTEVTSKTTEFTNGGWYVVNGEVGGGQIVVNGSAHLILGDGAKLTITNVANGEAAICVTEGNALTIYSQQEGTGKLDVTGGASAAGIGGGNNRKCGTVTINGGRVTAIGQGGGKGIGAGSGVGGATVIIRSGTIVAAGWNGLDGDPRIGGGNVKAWSNDKDDDHGPFAGHPKDATGKIDVYCVTVEVGKADGEKLNVVGPNGYGTRDIESIDGKLYLYLPEGDHHFAVDGVFYEASVSTAATTATLDESQNYAIVMVGELPEHVKTAVWTSGEGSVTNPVVNGFIVEKGTTDVRVIFTADEGYVLDGNPVVYVNIGDESVVNIADDVPTAKPTHVSVTLPTETVGYGFAVSNLTVVGSEAKIEPTKAGGTTYLLPIGAKVGIYAVPEEGYAVKDDPYIIESVSEGETIVPSSLPHAERLPAFVTVTSAKQRWPWNGKVDVGYTLSNTDAGEYYRLITAVTVGGTTKTVTNEVGAISDGNYKTTVDCAALFGADVLAPASITMAVRTYSAPAVSTKWRLTGPFLIIELTKDENTGRFPHQEYATAAELPENAWNLKTGWANDYKTKYLVMRKVKAGEAYPCQPNSSGTISGTKKPAKDYWIGVHQVTAAQYDRVMKEGGSISTDAKPKSSISWNEIRSGDGTKTISPTADVEENSFMGRLCVLTGLDDFDLPTEAQWEIAARAGSKEEYGSYVNADGIVQTATKDDLTPIAWYSGNNNPGGTKVVGQLRPNLWGLYDTAGNVWEWCRDCGNGSDPADVESPRVPPEGDSSDYRVDRGGCYGSVAVSCRPSGRGLGNADYAYGSIGFRLSRICEPDVQNK